MRVLLLSPLPPPFGGIATWTKEFVSAAKNAGIEIDVVNTALVGIQTGQQKRIIRLANELKRTAGILNQLGKCLKANHYDLVHINTSCSVGGLFRELICALKCKGHRIILHCHCNVPDWLSNNRIAVWIFKHVASRANCVIVLNKKSGDYLRRVISQPIIQIPNFIPTSIIQSTHVIREKIETALFVGHVCAEKGVREIIEVAWEYPSIQFKLVGAVSDEARNLPAPENVLFVGEAEHERVLEELKNADVFLLPSYTEGFSIALLEAMAYGVPIIASAVGANEETIENRGGILIPQRDAEAISLAIQKLSSSERRAEMSQWNLKKALDSYSLEVVLNSIISIYRGRC